MLKSSPPTDPITLALCGFLAHSPKLGDRICVGLSGGCDSVVLLHALNRLCVDAWPQLSLSALHVHHGLSPNADAWAAFCADLCVRLQVPLEVVRVQVPRHSGEGPEAAARRMRHRVFSDCAADWLLLAHHRDDQAETVLLNLLRGGGVTGGAGMRSQRVQTYGPPLVRPLLDVPREAIDRYAVAQGLRWIEDESNTELRFRRNFLRREIIPRLDAQFPAARRSLARSASHFAAAAGLLDDLAAIDLAAVCTASGRIGIADFNALTADRAANLLRFAWGQAGFRMPDERWLSEARKQLANTRPSSETCVSTPEGELHVFRGELFFVARCAATTIEPRVWRGEGALSWAGGCLRFESTCGAGFRASLLGEGQIVVRRRQGGERLRPHPKRPRRSLRNLLQESGVPPWERERLPCLWSGERLLWVGGLGVDAEYACAVGEPGWIPVWEP